MPSMQGILSPFQDKEEHNKELDFFDMMQLDTFDEIPPVDFNFFAPVEDVVTDELEKDIDERLREHNLIHVQNVQNLLEYKKFDIKL